MKLKSTYAALLLAENLNNAYRTAIGLPEVAFTPVTHREQSFYLYAIVETNNPGLMTYDEFIEKLDEPEFLAEIEDFRRREAENSAGMLKKKTAPEVR